MRPRAFLASAALALALSAAPADASLPGPLPRVTPPSTATAVTASGGLYDRRVVVVAEKGVETRDLRLSLLAKGLPVESVSETASAVIVVAPRGSDPEALASSLGDLPGAAYASPNRRYRALWQPDDPYFLADQWNLSLIGLPSAWDIAAATRGSGVKVAVIDSGADTGHVDLSANLTLREAWNYVQGTRDVYDDFGHGTHVSGIIAEVTDNGIGLAGVAPNAKVLPLKILDSQGYGDTIDLADAIRHAADHGAKVVNLSLGDSESDPYVYDAVKYALRKDVVIVAAAGNSGTSPVMFPASAPGVVAVAAVDENKALAGFGGPPFSNHGSALDLVAPGKQIWSAWPNDAVAAMTGTSMAAPHVAGVAALIRADSPGLSAARTQALMLQNAEDLGTAGWDEYYGYGLVRADLALSGTLPSGDPAEPDDVPSRAATGTLSLASSRTFEPSGDSDFTRYRILFGKRYRASTSALSAGADTYLTLWDPRGRILTESDDAVAGQSYSVAEFSAPYSGYVDVQVNDMYQKGGAYDLGMVEVPVAATRWDGPHAASLRPAFGTAVRMSARLLSGTTGVPGTAYWQKSADGTRWSTQGRIISKDGSFAFYVRPERKTFYRILWYGDSGHAGTISRGVAVVPKAYLSTPSGPTAPSAGVHYNYSGYLKPRHAAGTLAVRLQCYRLRSGVWTWRKEIRARVSDRWPYSTYSARVSFWPRGSWRVRAYHPADAINSASFSPYLGLTVR